MERPGDTDPDPGREIESLRRRLARADAALAECRGREERLHALLDQGPDAFLEIEFVQPPPDISGPAATDHRAVVRLWNRAAEQLYGYAREEIVGRPLSVLIPPDRAAEFRGVVDRLVGGDRVEQYETVRVRKDGTRVEVAVNLAPIRDPAGHVVGAAGIARDVTGRREAERQLRFQASLLDQVRNAVIATDPAGVITYWNRSAEALYQWTAGEVLGKNVMEVTVPATGAPAAGQVLAEVERTGHWEGEFLVRRKDGTVFAAHVSNAALRDDRGTLSGYVGISEDITGRKRAEAALRESHNLLEAVLEGIPQAVFVKDREGRYLLLNSPGARFVGRAAGEVIGRDDTTLFDAETVRRIQEADRRVMETGEILTYEEVGTAAGVTRTYLTTKAPFRGPDGVVRGVIGVARDISERKAAEEQLRRQNEILQTIFDHIPVMINFVDPAGRVRLVNREWERVLGWSPEEAQTRDMSAEFYPDPDERRRVMEFIHNPPPGWTDFRTRVRDGRVVHTSWANVLLSDGTSIGFGQDITGRKRAEAERERLHREVVAGRELLAVLSRRLIEAQEAERGHLARELHDEIGQILTTVNLTLEAVRVRAGPAAQARLDESVRVVNRVIEQVRSLSLDLRPASLDLLGLETALRAYLARQAARSGVTLEFVSSLDGERLPATLETVCFRVVQEATTNVLRHARATRCRVELRRTDEEVVITVADDGVGFDVAATRARMIRGEGFGLLGMLERVELFGGRIDLDSAQGAGTTIRVRFQLPMGENPVPP